MTTISVLLCLQITSHFLTQYGRNSRSIMGDSQPVFWVLSKSCICTLVNTEYDHFSGCCLFSPFPTLGSQLRSWLLYYSLPTLKGILPQVYMNHYALFVAAIHIFLSEEITETDLSNAEQYLKKFYEEYPNLYGMLFPMYMYSTQQTLIRAKYIYCDIQHFHIFIGDNAVTMKVHLLSHLPACVKNWGPLWAYSCFAFEGHNHVLKVLFHGTRQMNKQVSTFQ